MIGKKCRNKSISLLLAALLLLASCGSQTENAAPPEPEQEQSEEPEETEAEEPSEAVPEEESEPMENENWRDKYEAEDANLTSNSVLTSGANGISGKGYVGRFESSDSKEEFTVTVPEEGLYDLFIASIGIWGEKVAKLSVNGKEQGEFTVRSGSTPSEVEMQVYLNAGENTVAVLPSWTWFALDYIRLDKPSEDRLAAALEFDRELSNPNAGESAKKLWAFLTENYGNHVLVGQVSDRLSDPESISMLDLIFDSRVVDLGDSLFCSQIRDGFVAQLYAANKRDLASTLRANEKVINKSVENMIEGFAGGN